MKRNRRIACHAMRIELVCGVMEGEGVIQKEQVAVWLVSNLSITMIR